MHMLACVAGGILTSARFIWGRNAYPHGEWGGDTIHSREDEFCQLRRLRKESFSFRNSKHKSGQMPQAVKQSLTWMPETRFPVAVNSSRDAPASILFCWNQKGELTNSLFYHSRQPGDWSCDTTAATPVLSSLIMPR